MSNIRTNIAMRALPAFVMAGDAFARARWELNCLRSPRGSQTVHRASRYGTAIFATAPN